MRAKSIVLILIALGCGLVASIGISQVMDKKEPEAIETETKQIYVAATDIDINETLTSEKVRLESWPVDKINEGAVTDFEKIKDRFSRQRLFEGEQILERKLQDSTDGKTVLIPEGFRVATVRVTVDTVNAGLIGPGDRVDIIAFLRKSAEVPQTMTKTILRNVRIFAVNNTTERATDQEGNSVAVKSVSVLVEQKQIETLMLAMELGRLRMSLRRPDDTLEHTGGSASMQDLVGGSAEDADKDKTGTPNSGGPGFFGAFTNQPIAPVVPAGDEIKMQIFTPDGSSEFRWTNRDELPEQVGAGGTASAGLSGIQLPALGGAGLLPGDAGEPDEAKSDEEADLADKIQLDAE